MVINPKVIKVREGTLKSLRLEKEPSKAIKAGGHLQARLLQPCPPPQCHPLQGPQVPQHPTLWLPALPKRSSSFPSPDPFAPTLPPTRSLMGPTTSSGPPYPHKTPKTTAGGSFPQHNPSPARPGRSATTATPRWRELAQRLLGQFLQKEWVCHRAGPLRGGLLRCWNGAGPTKGLVGATLLAMGSQWLLSLPLWDPWTPPGLSLGGRGGSIPHLYLLAGSFSLETKLASTLPCHMA